MKNISTKVFAFIFLFSIVFVGCKKDQDQNLNEFGLVENVPGLNPDIIPVNEGDGKDILQNEPVETNDFTTAYNAELIGFDNENVKKGSIIVDYRNEGRIWIVKEKLLGKTNANILVTMVQGALSVLFHNAIIEFSTPENRAKTASSNSKKLESGKLKFFSNIELQFNMDIEAITIKDIVEKDGIGISVVDNTIEVSLTDFEVYSNSNNTFNVSIPEGKVSINNAIDYHMKFLPIEAILLGTSGTFGSIKEVDCALYSDVDADLYLDFELTTNGAVNLFTPVEKEIGSYNKIYKLGPVIISTKVNLVAKLNATVDATFNMTPHIINKNNFEVNFSYQGLDETPELNASYQNVLNDLTTNISSDATLNQRLEIIPRIEILAYGLVGPSGEIINYEEFNANVYSNNTLLTSDISLDIGMDYKSSLDASIFHVDNLTTSFFESEGNLFNTNLYKAPYLLEVVSGDLQNGNINTSLNEPIKFKVTDNYGNLLSDVPVFVETTTGNGSFNQGYFYTGSNGTVDADWTLGNISGTQSAKIYLKDGNNNKIVNSEKNIVAYTNGGGSGGSQPIANFTSNTTTVVEGGTVNFTDLSTNNPTSWTWSFPGGTPSSSTSQNPNVVYNTAGVYNVSLISSNAIGPSSQETKSGFITVTSCSSSGGIYPGNVVLTTQTEVNNFGCNGYVQINGNLTIEESFNGAIYDLSPLSSLVNISGLNILNNSDLTSLDGLENLFNVSGMIQIYGNNSLNNISSLSNLISANGLYVSYNASLTSIAGLDNMDVILGNLEIMQNALLNNIDALASLSTVTGEVNIYNNAQLSSLNLGSLGVIGDRLVLSLLPQVNDLVYLAGLQSVGGDLIINYNASLSDLCGITNLIVNYGLWGSYNVNNNAINPAKSDIQAGNCN